MGEVRVVKYVKKLGTKLQIPRSPKKLELVIFRIAKSRSEGPRPYVLSLDLSGNPGLHDILPT